MTLSELTSSQAVLAAIEECDRLGRDAFLEKYGFGRARNYYLVYRGRRYDSKAIVGAAYGFQYPSRGALQSGEFSGGEQTVQAQLERLGFVVRYLRADSEETSVPSLELYRRYMREDVHDIFSPDTRFTPQAGTWGLQGIVSVPDRPGDYVFFVTFGQEQSGHVFAEGITTEGVLTWQSQPRQSLSDKQILQFIRHDELRNSIYLFLRTNPSDSYTYLGTLKYLSHDIERQNPVHFQWQLQPATIPPYVCERMGLRLSSTEPHGRPDDPKGLKVTPAPARRRSRGTTTRTFQTRRKPDYSEIDATNTALGAAGERLVLAHEQQALIDAGRPELADRVRHVSLIEGDGAGYDIASFTLEGAHKYIEVKTTRGAEHTPFFMSANEVAFSQQHPDDFFLYRVYDCDPEAETGKLYVIAGDVTKAFRLTPTEYKVDRADAEEGTDLQ
jgi:hypothetical protein